MEVNEKIMKEFNYSYFSKTKNKIKYIEGRMNTHYIDWGYISNYQILSESFIERFQDKVDWEYISGYQQLSESFIERFQDKVDWGYISRHQKLSEPFIERFQDKVDWGYTSEYQELSESFIEGFQDKVNWEYISINQKLSESFIERFQDKVDWGYISIRQQLSESFIEKYKDKLKNYNTLTSQFYCGKDNRVIFITKNEPNIIKIGCSNYTKEEAIEKIKEKYKDRKKLMDDYINKVELCFKEANERKK